MRYCFLLALAVIIVLLCSCATQPKPPHLSLDQLRNNTVVQADCPRAETIIKQLEDNQLAAGIPRMNPEDLPTQTEREYQSLTRINIWALRIGCSNPTRYQ